MPPPPMQRPPRQAAVDDWFSDISSQYSDDEWTPSRYNDSDDDDTYTVSNESVCTDSTYDRILSSAL